MAKKKNVKICNDYKEYVMINSPIEINACESRSFCINGVDGTLEPI